MSPRTLRRAIAGVLLTALLAGCHAGGGQATGDGAPSGGTDAATAGGSGAATAGSGPTSSDEPGGPSSTATTTPSSAAADGTRCTTATLSGSLTEGDGGAAGSRLPFLVLTNTGSSTCTLQGWPGVSFVGEGNGTQLGAPADQDRTSVHDTVVLAPGGAAHAPLRIVEAGNYDAATCDPVTADGLRVYPPGDTASLFVASTAFTACRATSVHLLTVQALLPGTG